MLSKLDKAIPAFTFFTHILHLYGKKIDKSRKSRFAGSEIKDKKIYYIIN